MLGRMALLAATNSQAAATLWTPAQIATALWLDANDASTITTVSGAVSQWNDKSGNSRNAAQATTSLRPQLTTAPTGIRSERVATVPLASPPSLRLAANLPLSGDFTILVVAARANIADSIYAPLDTFSSSNVSTNNTKFFYYTAWGGFHTSLLSGGVPNLMTTSFVDTSLFMLRRAGTSGLFLKDGSSSSHAFSLATLDIGYVVGGAQGNFRSDNTTYEIIVCPYALTVSDCEKAQGYLAWNWGIQHKLASDHPYKSSAPTI